MDDLTCPECESGKIDEYIIEWGTCSVCGEDGPIEHFRDNQGQKADGLEIMGGSDR